MAGVSCCVGFLSCRFRTFNEANYVLRNTISIGLEAESP